VLIIFWSKSIQKKNATFTKAWMLNESILNEYNSVFHFYNWQCCSWRFKKITIWNLHIHVVELYISLMTFQNLVYSKQFKVVHSLKETQQTTLPNLVWRHFLYLQLSILYYCVLVPIQRMSNNVALQIGRAKGDYKSNVITNVWKIALNSF